MGKSIALLLSVMAWGAVAEPREPEYRKVDGKNDDWLFCADHVDRSYADNIYNVWSMDVFYLGPSVVETNADFCALDDERLPKGLKDRWNDTAASFAATANVYVPCYRQLSKTKEFALTNGCPRLVAASNLVSFLSDSVAYADVVKAMNAYFSKFNPSVGRPFVLVGEGQGAVLLQLLMEQYFTTDARRSSLDNLVACYADGHVVDTAWPTILAERTGLVFQSLSNLSGSTYKTYAGWVSETEPLDWDALPEDADRRRAALRAERTLTVDPTQPDDPTHRRFRTITNAVEYAASKSITGCTIAVAPGVYREHVSLYCDVGYNLVSTQPLGAIIDGEGTHRCAEMTGDVVARANFHGFVFRNGFAGDGCNGGGVFNCDLCCSVVSNCSARGHGGGVAFGRLNQCLVVRNRCDGLGGGAYGTSFNACTIANNQATGTNRVGGVYNDSPNEVGLNSIVALNNPSNVVGMSDLEIDRAIRLFAEGDPRFVDAEHDDYRLHADSPCVDAGFGDFARHDVDLAGNPRVLGAEVDYGCFEHLRYAALPPGSLNVSSNAQTVGSVVYAQRPWSLTVESDGGWLSSDVSRGVTNSILHFRVAENTTSQTRTGRIRVLDAVGNVQTVRVDQVAGAELAPFARRKGVFVGVTEFEKVKDEEGELKPWEDEITGCVEDSVSYRKLWCGPDPDGEHAQLFTNAFARLVSVSNAVEAMIESLKPDEEFMMSFSTHGTPGKGIWETAFSLYPNGERYAFGLLSNQLQRAAAKCRKVIVVADACHSAAAFKFAEQMTADAEITETHGLPLFAAPRRLMAASTPQVAPYAGITNIAFIVAADYDEASLSGSDECPHGEFTAGVLHAFLDGSFADADGDGYLDFHELYRSGRAHSERMGDPNPRGRWQARCYNKDLLLETRAFRLNAPKPPKPYMSMSPYYFDFTNWLKAKGLGTVEPSTGPEDIEAVATNALKNVGGISRPVWEAFVALGDAYRPEPATNAPFALSIAVGKTGVPSVMCVPDLSTEVPRRRYTLYGKGCLTNAAWQVVTTNDLGGCRFFRAEVELK